MGKKETPPLQTPPTTLFRGLNIPPRAGGIGEEAGKEDFKKSCSSENPSL